MFIHIKYSLQVKIHRYYNGVHEILRYGLIQELSTFHGDLHYENCLHQTPTSDRQLTKEAV